LSNPFLARNLQELTAFVAASIVYDDLLDSPNDSRTLSHPDETRRLALSNASTVALAVTAPAIRHSLVRLPRLVH
jgi:hypothetical protein